MALSPRQVIVATRTITPSSSSASATESATTETPITTTTSSSSSSQTANPIPSIIAVIVPNPQVEVFQGIPYQLGYADINPPKNAVPNSLRQVTPLITYPNYTTDAFPAVGSLDIGSYDTSRSGWCSVPLSAYTDQFSFTFDTTGWYQFVVNTTWVRPTVDGPDPSTNCTFPITSVLYLYATQTISVQPTPTTNFAYTSGSGRLPPAYTAYLTLSTDVPGSLPVDVGKSSSTKNMIIGFTIAGVCLVLIGMGTTLWIIRRRQKNQREALAFSRLTPEEQVEFLQSPEGSRYRSNYVDNATERYPPPLRVDPRQIVLPGRDYRSQVAHQSGPTLGAMHAPYMVQAQGVRVPMYQGIARSGGPVSPQVVGHPMARSPLDGRWKW